MPGLYSIITRAPGTLITALIYNADHQVHVDGRAAEFMQSYSTSVAQMNITEDPQPKTDPSLAATLAGEIARLRFVIAALKTTLSGEVPVNWYDPLVAPVFGKIGARVRRTTAQTIAASTTTTVSFTGGTVEFSNNNVWISGSPTRFTAPFNGQYYFYCGIVWGQPAAGTAALTLGGTVNGAVNVGQTTQTWTSATAPGAFPMSLAGLYEFNATDYIEFNVFQSNASSLNLEPSLLANVGTVGSLIFLGTS